MERKGGREGGKESELTLISRSSPATARRCEPASRLKRTHFMTESCTSCSKNVYVDMCEENLFIYLFIHLFIYLFIYLFIHLFSFPLSSHRVKVCSLSLPPSLPPSLLTSSLLSTTNPLFFTRRRATVVSLLPVARSEPSAEESME